MKINTLADLKRALQLGVNVLLISSDLPSMQAKFSGKGRKVIKVQTNAIQFEPTESGRNGSWLDLASAKDFQFFGDDRFSMLLDRENSTQANNYQVIG